MARLSSYPSQSLLEPAVPPSSVFTWTMPSPPLSFPPGILRFLKTEESQRWRFALPSSTSLYLPFLEGKRDGWTTHNHFSFLFKNIAQDAINPVKDASSFWKGVCPWGSFQKLRTVRNSLCYKEMLCFWTPGSRGLEDELWKLFLEEGSPSRETGFYILTEGATEQNTPGAWAPPTPKVHQTSEKNCKTIQWMSLFTA